MFRFTLAAGVLWLVAPPPGNTQAVVINHQQVGCVIAEKFPRIGCGDGVTSL